jgi:YrbI family 3-deoxy-D-manno-octulosonate 8-phosphate phosphatase
MNEIKLVVFDFDGVFSDKIYVSCDNKFTKSYNSKDSYALKLLKDKGIKIGITTGCDKDIINNIDKIIGRVDFISQGDYKKIDKIKEWCEYLQIDLDNVAYIGDDLFDSDFMDLVGFSACPSDAIKECKDKSDYICFNKGGDGAVREFSEKILEINSLLSNKLDSNLRKYGKITAVIPVRSGSSRCLNKNIRRFGDTNLLDKKIKLLKKINEIDEILVSSDSDEMLKIAIDNGVKIDKRPKEYAETNTPGYKFYEYISNKVNNPILMYMHVVSPFTTIESIKDSIEIFRNSNNDSVACSHNFKHFLFKDGKPLNYKNFEILNSQSLPDIYVPNFSPIIISTDFVRKTKSLIGLNPYFHEVSQMEAIDIDTNYDFLVSELLYKNEFHDINDVDNYMNVRSQFKLEFLDCTIRDGGYINNWNFTDEEVIECYKAVSKSGYDYFEIGFMRKKYDFSKGKWYSVSEEDLEKVSNSYNGCKIAVMISIGDNKELILKSKSITLVRLHLRLVDDLNINSKLIEETIILFNRFNSEGYEVCLNLASSDKYDLKQIEYVINNLSNLEFKCIYLADTFGNLNEYKTKKQLYNFQKQLYKLNSNIPMAFHSHNNNGNALGKTLSAIDFGVKMVDSTIMGLGRGAGNLLSENLILELLERGYEFNIKPILKYGSSYIRNYNDSYKDSKFIYNNTILYSLSSYFNIHPDYVKYINDNKIEIDIEEIFDIFSKISKDNDLSNNFNKNIFKI